MNEYEERELRNLASALYDVRYSLSCDYCTKEKCRTDKSGGVSRKSCLDCIMDYWRDILNEKAGKRKIREVKDGD